MFDDLFDTRISVCSSCLRPIIQTVDVKKPVCLCTIVKETSRQHLKQRLDPDKNCGVIISSSGLPCMRSLTCKSHSLTSKRKVQGRSKPFDALLRDRNVLFGKKIVEQQSDSLVKSIGIFQKFSSINMDSEPSKEPLLVPAVHKCLRRQIRHLLKKPLIDHV